MFGRSYLLDLYGCQPETVDDLDLAYRYLEGLVDVLGMTKQGPPFVIHAPTKDGKELYPGKVGISGWIPLIESGIQIHTIKPKNFISIDVYTCGALDTETILQYTIDIYAPTRWEQSIVDRGTEYEDLLWPTDAPD